MVELIQQALTVVGHSDYKIGDIEDVGKTNSITQATFIMPKKNHCALSIRLNGNSLLVKKLEMYLIMA